MGHWGWYIINYLFLSGLGAGAYLTSFAAEKGWFGQDSNLKRAGYFLAGPTVAIGIFLFALNLGVTLKGLITMVSNPRSVMSWGIYILTIFTIVGFICSFYTRQNQRIPTLLSSLGALLALATGIYTGALLSAVFAVPFWNTSLLPFLFVMSAFSTGLASTSLLTRFTEKKRPVVEWARINRIQVVLVVGELILLSLLLAITLIGRNGVVAASSARMILIGSLAVPFWLLLIAVGSVIPLLFHLLQNTKGEESSKRIIATLSDVAVLIGGITLRAVVVLSGVPIWNGIVN